MTDIQRAGLKLDSAIEYLRHRDPRPGHAEVYGGLVVGRSIGDDLAIDALLVCLSALAAEYRIAVEEIRRGSMEYPPKSSA